MSLLQAGIVAPHFRAATDLEELEVHGDKGFACGHRVGPLLLNPGRSGYGVGAGGIIVGVGSMRIVNSNRPPCATAAARCEVSPTAVVDHVTRANGKKFAPVRLGPEKNRVGRARRGSQIAVEAAAMRIGGV